MPPWTFQRKVNRNCPGFVLPSGIYYSTVSQCIIGSSSLVYRVRLLSRYIVQKECALINCSSITFSESSSFGNGLDLHCGMQNGNRAIPLCADLDLVLAIRLILDDPHDNDRCEYRDLIACYLSACTSKIGVIESHTRISNSNKISDSYIGSAAMIDGAAMIQNSTLLSESTDPVQIRDGVCLSDSILQCGTRVTSMVRIRRSLLLEHCEVKRHGQVTHSIVGPNSIIAEGEVTSSLVGPFVAAHHQSLLISALWPSGRGNIGYGANVGSNHTSKQADQEIFVGEGVFFGLGANIKFPANYLHAPYSIIATAVNTLPQSVEFPFSLIRQPTEILSGLSPAFNEIIPVWVLSDNIYMIFRARQKFQKRNRARKTTFASGILHFGLMKMVQTALNRLSNVSNKEIYLEQDIPGLGKNFLKEQNRLKAIQSYHYYLKYYALTGLLREIKKLSPHRELSYSDIPLRERWIEEWPFFQSEGLTQHTISQNLLLLGQMQQNIADQVEQSKAKDDHRGQKIIPHYDQYATPAQRDSIVKMIHQETGFILQEINQILQKITPYRA